METERIQQYYLSCNCKSIKLAFTRIDKDGNNNDLYYSTFLNKGERDFNNALDTAEYDDKTWQRLISFNSRLTTIQKKIINLYRIVCEQNDKTGNEKRDLETVISIKENVVKKLFTPLEYNTLFIKSLVGKDDYLTAIKVRAYLGNRLERIILDLKQVYQIDINKSPLKDNFKQLVKSYKKTMVDLNDFKRPTGNINIKRRGFKKKAEKIKTLKELFVYPETYDLCIEVLKNVKPPILNIDNKYIGKEKGAFVVWVDILKQKNLIARSSNDEDYSRLISKTFVPFSISSELFRKEPKRAKERYETEFNLLLSQVYQSVKMVK